jgi:hypothetical protein
MSIVSLNVKSYSAETFKFDDRIVSFPLENLILKCAYDYRIFKWNNGSTLIDCIESFVFPQIYLITTLKYLVCNNTRDTTGFTVTDEIVNLTNLRYYSQHSYGYGKLSECLAVVPVLNTFDCYWTPKQYFKYKEYMYIFNDLMSRDESMYFESSNEYYFEIPSDVKYLTVDHTPICSMCMKVNDETGAIEFTNLINELGKSTTIEVLKINSKHMLLQLLDNMEKIPKNLKRLEINMDIQHTFDFSKFKFETLTV